MAQKRKPAAVAFAPRLALLHDALDRAVCAAYGWDAAIVRDGEAMLRALLALNAARAGEQPLSPHPHRACDHQRADHAEGDPLEVIDHHLAVVHHQLWVFQRLADE